MTSIHHPRRTQNEKLNQVTPHILLSE